MNVSQGNFGQHRLFSLSVPCSRGRDSSGVPGNRRFCGCWGECRSRGGFLFVAHAACQTDSRLHDCRKALWDIPGNLWGYPRTFVGIKLGIFHKILGLLGDLFAQIPKSWDPVFLTSFLCAHRNAHGATRRVSGHEFHSCRTRVYSGHQNKRRRGFRTAGRPARNRGPQQAPVLRLLG